MFREIYTFPVLAWQCFAFHLIFFGFQRWFHTIIWSCNRRYINMPGKIKEDIVGMRECIVDQTPYTAPKITFPSRKSKYMYILCSFEKLHQLLNGRLTYKSKPSDQYYCWSNQVWIMGRWRQQGWLWLSRGVDVFTLRINCLYRPNSRILVPQCTRDNGNHQFQ